MQFLAHDGKVLRFDGLVADREGAPQREVVVHFYLGDLSVEVKEAGAGLLLHRQRVLAMADIVDDKGLDQALVARRAEAEGVGA